MSECDNPDEHCETSRVREEKAMGDVQEKTEDDSHPENPIPESPRQEADGASESFDDKPSPNDTPSTDSVKVVENCESLENTAMQESNEVEAIDTLAEDFKDSSESSSNDSANLPRPVRDPCRCEMCRVKRRILMEEMERALRLNSLWTDLRKHIHSVFHSAMTVSRVPNSFPILSDTSPHSNLENSVVQLSRSDPHQLSMRLVSQAQEFVVEVKVQLLTLLHKQTTNHLAGIFLTRMLDGYDALISTAIKMSELLQPVEKEYFQKFNLTWESFNKKLYQDYVYTDPLIQDKLPGFIGEIRNMLSQKTDECQDTMLPQKRFEYHVLELRYRTFDDEMTRIVDLWPEAVQLIDEHNMEQSARIVKLRRFREGWETFTKWWKQVQQQETYKRHERMQKANNQLVNEPQEGVTTASPNGRVPSPVCLLDTLSIPPKHDIAQFLLDAKTSHQRLVDVLKSIIVSKDHLTVKDYGINMTNHPNMNDLEFQCGYECASTLIQSFATLIANRRNKDKCNEKHVDSSPVIDEENCTYCTLSPLLNSNPFMEKELSTEEECKDIFPPFNNDIAGMAKRIASNFSAIKDLYNQVSSAMPCECPEVVAPQERMKLSLNEVEPKLLIECEPELAQKTENIPNCITEDVDFRKLDFQSCPCVYQHTKDIAEKRKEVDSPPCPCLLNSKRKLDTCLCLKKTCVSAPVDVTSNGHSEVKPPAVVHSKSDQEPANPVMKTSSTNSAQTQTRHSTTQTRSTPHHHNRTARQGSTHSQEVKTAASAHKAHSHGNQSSGSCHKQHVVEHIKRVSCSDLSPGDGDCSDSGSSHEDSCSTSSSSPRDSNRHCDCCYCEVFGHGVPSVAPVSRNYNEMRDRLRQLLTKKKATKCKAACSPPKSPAESLPSNTNSDSKTTTSSHSAPRSNTPLSTASTVLLDNRDQRDLDALLEFIEGGQNGKRDNKKAEKKARQKQKKIEDKLKQERLEVERQKLIEIQKKTPEVTITVVDPQRPMPQRLHSHRNLPEISILPASPSVVLTSLKPSNIKNKKKDKYEAPSVVSASSKVNTKTKAAAHTNQKNKGPVSVDRVDGISNSNQSSKNSIKSDKGSNTNAKTTGNKAQASNASIKKNSKAAVPPPAPPPEPEPIDESLLTKKERKKLRREMRKMEEAKAETENQLQIVTIKRVMESNSAEPTVTITLKGQTPAEDKVLFTLVNGQTKEPNKSDQGQNAGGKKKKNKNKNSNNSNNSTANNSNQVQQNNKVQQPNVKQQQQVKNVKQDGKNVKQQIVNEKTKGGKQVESLKLQQVSVETKSTKSKKDKKNTENKENVSQQQNTSTKNKNQQQNQEQNLTSKKQNKVNSSSQLQPVQKQTNLNNEVVDKKTKTQQQNKNNQTNAKKNNKNVNNSVNNNVNNKSNTNKTDTSKNQTKVNQNTASKQKSVVDMQIGTKECVSPLFSSQFKDISASSKINIENLKLPPGITITKVDTPARPLPIKTTMKPKPPNPPKQTTIIAAPMNSAQSGYANQQNGGNVIVVDTGKLKQDLMPKSTDKDASKENQGGKKKKKKKNKNAANQNGSSSTNVLMSQNNDYNDESARILHNPQTNMVTIRNPAFGPPKMEPASQQAAIIKVSENGMVTIRSPALQHAINAGLTPAPKPDFIVKGDLTAGKANTNSSNPKHTNGIIPSSLAELRSRLTPDCTSLSDLANIQISKVTNGQPIPENGINIKGTSVTLTKVRNPEPMIDEVQQAKTAVREAINASMAVSSSGKGKKKKKRGNGARQSGDDWNLVESVFTPKDIDLEDGEMDDAERELEAFKRFCQQSVPPPRKEKVNLNIKDIVLKKKSSSSTAAAAPVIAAN